MVARATSASLLESALQLHERGELAQAERQYARLLAMEPDNVQGLHCAGVLALQSGKHDLAAGRLQRAIDLGAGLAGTYYLLGRAQKGSGRLDDAIRSYERAIGLDPRLADVHVSLAIALRQQGRLEAAETACRAALELAPGSFEARLNFANVLQARGQLEAALAEYERVESIRSASDELQYNFGKALRGLGRNDDAARRFQDAIRLNAEHLDAYLNLGNTLVDIKQHDAAVDCYARLLQLIDSGAGRRGESTDIEELRRNARAGLAAALIWCYRYEEALELLREALDRTPDSVALLEHLLVILPFRLSRNVDVQRIYEQYQRVIPLRNFPSLLSENRRADPPDRLRIGYLSADLRDHSVAFFMEPILANHDKQAFEVVCYSLNKKDDHVTERLRGYADSWVDAVELSDRQIAERVVADRIDILVDLSGRTLNNRLGTLAFRPAALQLGYLGYPTCTGVHQIEYRLTDPVIDPPDDERALVLEGEQPLRLPTSMFCYRPPEEAPELPVRRVEPGRPVCFGSFNQVPKIAPDVIAAWVSILQAVPGSRLLLKSFGFNDAGCAERMRQSFAQAGIADERVVIRGGETLRRDHLALYGEIDIVLDTFPYNGATTTCEALWMGVPVVTLAGETHASRVGASILGAMGLQDLVATTLPGYVATAAALAADPARLQRLHADLRSRFQVSPLRDEPGFTREFERLLRDAWVRGHRSPVESEPALQRRLA